MNPLSYKTPFRYSLCTYPLTLYTRPILIHQKTLNQRSCSTSTSFLVCRCRVYVNINHCVFSQCDSSFWIGQDLLWFPVAAAPSAPSIPGKACAILLNKFFTLCPTFALVSMNIRLFFLASSSPCCVVTSRLSFKSVLLPTNTIITSLPRSPRTSSTHFRVFWKDLASGTWSESFASLPNEQTYSRYHKPPLPHLNL